MLIRTLINNIYRRISHSEASVFLLDAGEGFALPQHERLVLGRGPQEVLVVVVICRLVVVSFILDEVLEGLLHFYDVVAVVRVGVGLLNFDALESLASDQLVFELY